MHRALFLSCSTLTLAKDSISWAPQLAWLEEFAKLPGETVLVELPDLTNLISAGRGNIACECTKDQLSLVLSIVRGKVLEVMNQIATKH